MSTENKELFRAPYCSLQNLVQRNENDIGQLCFSWELAGRFDLQHRPQG
jgi:hypothetical protein